MTDVLLSETDAAALQALGRLLGTWTTEATHPAFPGVVVHGSAVIEWLEGERFLIQRARTDHPAFPDSISVIGITGTDRIQATPLPDPQAAGGPRRCVHYFDSRGVFRLLEWSIDATAWRVWRHAPGFSQRFTGTFAEGGNSIVGQWQLCQDEIHWQDDLQIRYRHQAHPG